MLFRFVVVSCLAVPALAQICCTPTQWEATEVILGGGRFGQSNEKKIKLVSYDAENNRSAVSENTTSYIGADKRMHTITDYKAMKEYEINLDDESCKVKDLSGDFEPICIEDSDTLENSGVLGISSNSISTSTYKKKDNGFFSKAYYFTVTDAECVPVLKSRGSKITYYTDVTSGIVDVNVFTPPEYCDEKTPMERVLVSRKRFQKL